MLPNFATESMPITLPAALQLDPLCPRVHGSGGGFIGANAGSKNPAATSNEANLSGG
ncbi:MAG TPA: hypothetical protein VFL63_05155 [Rhodanobacteraceae bacterium]|nr:hypothetical protein [Rhodanobacteraceae bacterium]